MDTQHLSTVPDCRQSAPVCALSELGLVFDEAVKAGVFRPEQSDELDKLRAQIAFGDPNAEAAPLLHGVLAPSLAPDMALDVIRPLFEPGDVIELRALDPAGGRSQSLHGLFDDPHDRELLLGFIARHVGLRNLYFGANPRVPGKRGSTSAANDADVLARRAIAFDLDYKDAPPVDPDWSATVAALRELCPELEVQTGNGVQVWFRLNDPMDAAASAAVVADLMAQVGADNVADAPRIMRLPFTVNLPTATKRARGNVPRLAVLCLPKDEAHS